MSAEFSEYEPARPSPGVEPRVEPLVRTLVDADLGPYAALISARQRIPAAAGMDWARKEADRMQADPGRHRVLVALANERIVGYGKAVWFDPPEGAPANIPPAGWHLAGVVVSPSHRRRGVATALVRARLAWIEERDPVAWYFANERNRATIDLHAPFGFREVTRDFQVPGVEFSGGASGILFRAEAPWRA